MDGDRLGIGIGIGLWWWGRGKVWVGGVVTLPVSCCFYFFAGVVLLVGVLLCGVFLLSTCVDFLCGCFGWW